MDRQYFKFTRSLIRKLWQKAPYSLNNCNPYLPGFPLKDCWGSFLWVYGHYLWDLQFEKNTNLILKLDLTVLFIHLKIILLQYFQFLVISRIQTNPIYLLPSIIKVWTQIMPKCHISHCKSFSIVTTIRQLFLEN